ncbi:MAG: acyl carrier protein [Stappiaceae bacterium]
MFHVNKGPKPASLGLGGDGDELELLDEIETTFGITFSDEECERIFSLDDIYQIICSKLPKDPDNRGKCLTAMAYYRLNNALGSQGKILPATRVRLPHGWSAKHFQNQLEKKSGLNLEWLTTASPGVVTLAILQFITWIAAPIMLS